MQITNRLVMKTNLDYSDFQKTLKMHSTESIVSVGIREAEKFTKDGANSKFSDSVPLVPLEQKAMEASNERLKLLTTRSWILNYNQHTKRFLNEH